MQDIPSRTEEMLLLVVCGLEDEAFGLDIRREVEQVTGRQYSIGGIYVPLDRLVRKGWLETEEGHPGPERMGRPRKRYMVSADGLEALRAARMSSEAMWAIVPGKLQRRLGLT